MLVVSCGSLISASESEQKVAGKQEKRSLSHGELGGGYPSSIPNFSGSYGSYGLTGGLVGGSGYFGGSGLIGGASIVSGPAPAIVSSGPLAVSGGPIVTGPGIVSGVSTNTNTLTTVRQNVPVPVPVDRPIPM